MFTILIGADADEQLDQAQRFCFGIMEHYWSGVQRGYRSPWPLPESEEVFDDTDLSDQEAHLARQLGETAARLGPAEAGFRIGGIYTALLPENYRSQNGTFYTPPLIDL